MLDASPPTFCQTKQWDEKVLSTSSVTIGRNAFHLYSHKMLESPLPLLCSRELQGHRREACGQPSLPPPFNELAPRPQSQLQKGRFRFSQDFLRSQTEQSGRRVIRQLRTICTSASSIPNAPKNRKCGCTGASLMPIISFNAIKTGSFGKGGCLTNVKESID